MSAIAEKVGESTVAEVTVLTPAADKGVSKAKAKAQALRKKRSQRLLRRFAVFVLLPTALAATYFGAIASNQYESSASFSVQSSDARPMIGMEGLLAGLASGGGRNDVLAVRDYVLSRDMLQRLDKEHGFIKHYKDKRADWFSRLHEGASFEEAYEYYAHKVYADYDTTSGSITIKVRAFDAKSAQLFARSLLAYSEEMVNKLSDRERKDRTGYAESDLKRAEQRLSEARKRLVALQQEHSEFSPLQTANSTMEVRTRLEGELARARAELMQRKAFMQDNAPQVLAAEEVVKSISAQIANENRRLVDPRKPEGLGTTMADFEAAMVEKEFSQKAYQSAMANLEVARADADRQHRYIALVANPSLPDQSTYPHRTRSIITAFFLSFLLLGVGSLISAAVREHARL
jgi:capsular polysaccharide transport system permease protein